MKKRQPEMQIGEWKEGLVCECGNDIFEWHSFMGKIVRVCTKCQKQQDIPELNRKQNIKEE